jgi:hypothetical protein
MGQLLFPDYPGGVKVLDEVTTAVDGEACSMQAADSFTATLETGLLVATNKAYLESAHEKNYAGTWNLLEEFDLSVILASKCIQRHFKERYPFVRWRTDGVTGGPVTAYIQGYQGA